MSTEKTNEKVDEYINGSKVIRVEQVSETVTRKYLENGMYVDIVSMTAPLA